mgnify:CR=1 FL=1
MEPQITWRGKAATKKKLNNRDTNYTNFHELLLGYEEILKKKKLLRRINFWQDNRINGIISPVYPVILSKTI